jgi:hypothetical protein
LYWDKNPHEDPTKPSLGRHEVDALRDGPVKSAAVQEWEEYEMTVKVNEVHAAFIAEVEAALKNDDDYAVSLVFERRDYEYEGVEVNYLENTGQKEK